MIWDSIWQADMKQNGLIPLIKGISDREKDIAQGYIVVDTAPFESSDCNLSNGNREVKVLVEVSIPEEKKKSYDLVGKLFDNYRLRRNASEGEANAEENKDINEFLEFAIKQAPMVIAKKHAEEHRYISQGASDDEWIRKLRTIWFETFYENTTCGFEHIFVGEEGSGTDPNPCRRNGQPSSFKELGGHHFWYHYYLHDGPYEQDKENDSIIFLKGVEVIRSERSQKAEIITIRYIYDAKDAGDTESIRLYKETGGFFVGLSAEGILAIGTIAMMQGRDSIDITINDEEYVLKVYRNNGHLRTFWPEFKYPKIL